MRNKTKKNLITTFGISIFGGFTSLFIANKIANKVNNFYENIVYTAQCCCEDYFNNILSQSDNQYDERCPAIGFDLAEYIDEEAYEEGKREEEERRKERDK